MHDTTSAFATQARRLDEARRRAAAAEGQRRLLAARDAALVLSVGRAKGRLALKPQVDAFLEGLQSDANARAVVSYGRLLTALADDVLGQDIKIGLDLYTERGLPGLDIYAEQAGRRVDLFEAAGGSLTNVVCLGLRGIATVKSGLRPFLALDEADCWLRQHRVPAFYRVVKQMAEKMRFQALVISHHDIADFAGGINVLAVSGTPQAGLRVDVRPGAAEWPEPGSPDADMPGIRGIRLRQCAGYIDCWLPLSPGVNAIIGENNIGKSMALRFLRAVAYGDRESISDMDIRHGETRADVEIHLERGRVLHWSREIKRNPIMQWRLCEADGTVVRMDGESCDGGSKGVPDWVEKVLGIARRESLDIQIGHQKRPVFLLGDAASKRAAVLSIGRESAKIRGMIARHKAASAEDQRLVKEGERELGALRARMLALNDVDTVQVLLDQAANAFDAQREAASLGARLEASVRLLGTAYASLADTSKTAECLAGLAEPPDLTPRFARNRDIAAAILRFERLGKALTHSRATLAGLSELAAEPPEMRPIEAIIACGRRIRDASAAAADAQAKTEALRKLAVEVPELRGSDAIDRAIRRIAVAVADHARAAAMSAALENLAPEMPTLADTSAAFVALRRLGELAQSAKSASAEAAADTERTRDAAGEVAAALDEMGNICPLCASQVAHDTFLHAHDG